MKVVALVANAAQLVILLAIFSIRGLELGALVILLLFVLIAIPFINFLAIFFSNRPMPESASAESGENGLIKREAMRVRYRNDHCPVMKTAGTAFAVVDLSEGGVCIRASLSIPFKKKISGEIQLISGDRFRFKATALRREEGIMVFQFADPIGTAMLLEEKKTMAADNTDHE